MMPPDRIPLHLTTIDPSSARETWHNTVPALQREVERLAGRVMQLEREKADVEAFAAVAAHEMVEPLVMAEAFVAIVTERLPGPEHADSLHDLETLRRSMARLRLLSETLLHEARSNERRLELATVDMTALTQRCVDMLGPEISARGARVEVGELPAARGEEILLSGVLANLLTNALKYSPREGAVIRVGGEHAGGICSYFVDSEGPPIPGDARVRIFAAYERGPKERRAVGAGLGLSICRRIVRRHGGEIAVSDAPGGGNRFYFTLPAA